MMGRKFVSVVMPVYNAEKTLDASIRSLLAQTYTDWELICVNDGSTDGSLAMLEKYAESDSRIRVVSQKNGGVAAARKTAYQMMDSEYAVNLDADDEFSCDLLERCVARAVETGADIIVPNCICETGNGRSFDWNKAYGYSEDTRMTGLDAYSRTFIPSTMHGYLMWKSELLKEFACPEGEYLNVFSEDEYLRRVLFLNAELIAFCGGYYVYRSNEESITKKFSAHQLGYLTTCRQMISLSDDYDIPSDVQDIVKENYMRTVISLKIKSYAFPESLNASDTVLVRKEIRKSYRDALRYRKSIKFADKSRPWVYRLASLSGYPIFCLTSKLMAKSKFA